MKRGSVRRSYVLAVAVMFLASAAACTKTPQRSSGPTARPSVPAPALARWSRVSDAPVARAEVTAAKIGDAVAVVGGIDAGGPSRVVEKLSRDATGVARWKRLPDLPFALHHAMATSLRGHLVVLGGFGGGRGPLYTTVSARVVALGCPGLRSCRSLGAGWVELPPLLRARGAGAAATTGDGLVVVAGRDGHGLVASTDVFDASSETWHRGVAIPTPRDHVAAVRDDATGIVYVIGGRAIDADAVTGAVEAFDAARGAWMTLPSLTVPRGGLAAVIADSRIVVFGGEGPRGVYANTDSFDIAARRWSSLAAMPQARHGLAGATFGSGPVYAIGGGARKGYSISARVDMLGTA